MAGFPCCKCCVYNYGKLGDCPFYDIHIVECVTCFPAKDKELKREDYYHDPRDE